MKSIPLEALHRELGAKFGPFAGYQMPIQYPAGLKAEHLHTRAHAGLFDVSHMGQLRITAADNATLIREMQAALPVDFTNWPADVQRYSVLLNDQGGIEDDLMLVWRPGAQAEVRMVVNAGNRDADLALLQRLAPSLSFAWVDAALIALQGPDAEAVLAKLDPAAAQLTFMQAAELQLCGASCFTTRSGYTGEDGYEISIPAQHADRVVRAILADDRVRPVGLGARDTLRLEAGLPLHGNDISPTVTPVEAGLSFAIAQSRRQAPGGFPGASVVLAQLANVAKGAGASHGSDGAQGAQRKLVGLISRDAVPIRAHAPIVDAAGNTVGEVTSGTVSPSLGHPVMLAMVAREALGGPLSAVVRERRLPLEVVKLPFVPKRYKR